MVTKQGHDITLTVVMNTTQKLTSNITQDGNIAVSDYDNKWISVHEPSGKFVSKVRIHDIV